jgi:hypothetical protein
LFLKRSLQAIRCLPEFIVGKFFSKCAWLKSYAECLCLTLVEMNKNLHFPAIMALCLGLLGSLLSCTQPQAEAAAVAPPAASLPLPVVLPDMLRYIEDPSLHGENWDDLPQLKFWRAIINLPKDTSIVSLASDRTILGKIPSRTWYGLNESQRSRFRQVLRQRFELGEEEEIYVTHGRRHFYQIHKVLPSIDKALEPFASQGVNPWYGQAILLIESPGQLQASHVGAYGPFQLMESVARQYGLEVSNQRDDRAHFGKSAMAAARLIKDMCIPYTRRMLNNQGITYRENDLFFRLLALHCYHAGPGNVASALRKMAPQQGGMQLIRELWTTEAKGFKNASQNYSQVALAALLELDDMIHQKYDMVCAYGEETLLEDFYVRRYAVQQEIQPEDGSLAAR